MRSLAWLLLLANLGMLVWLLTQPYPQPEQYRAIPVPPGIEPLVLLSERTPHAAAPSASASDMSAPASDSSAPEADPSAPASDPSAPASDPPGTTPPTDATDEAAPPKVAAPAPVPPAASQAERAPPTTCHAVGPFTEPEAARFAGAELEAAGYRSQPRAGEVRQPSGYWVYLPAMPAAQARRIVAELDAHGMSDYFIGNQNYISLGIFSDKSKAQARLEQIRQLGFDAVLDQRYRTRKVYWIDLEPAAQPLLVSAVWTQLQQRYPDIRVQRVSCD